MDRTSRKLIPFLLVIAAVILANVASTTLFTRADLTRNKVYSLSEASREAVATLEEPLTIKAFFSPNLPAPYNNAEQTLRDLLDEYALAGNRFFNYDFITVPSPDAAAGETTSPEEEEARKYRIYPIQIQNVQQDEVKLQNAYLGVAIIHGDMLETIPAVTSSARLEYQITSLIDDMSDKISALLTMREDITVTLVMTGNLVGVSGALETLPTDLESAVAELNSEYYGRLDFGHVDPFEDGIENVEERYDAAPVTLRTGDGSAEKAYATVLVSRGDRNYPIDVITRGIFGAQVAGVDSLKEQIASVSDSLIGIQEEVGFMTGYGVPQLGGQANQQSPVQPTQTDLANFNRTVSAEYSIRRLDLDSEPIPESISTLIVVSPSSKLSDYALFQLDQFLMRGNTLFLILDSHSVIMPQTNQYGGGQPAYIPRNTGIEELIKHYGVELEQAYVFDENCYVQRQQTAQGGVNQMDIYFAPIIAQHGYNEDLRFLSNMPEMVVLNMSPVRPSESRSSETEAHPLFSSSDDGWTMEGEGINLSNPYMITPPPDEEQESIPMGWILEGSFDSYFADREIPEPPEPEEETDADDQVESLENIDVLSTRLAGGTGRLVVLGGSGMIGSNVLDGEGGNGNATFLLNTLDYLSGRESYAIMRTKGRSYAPLEETTAGRRSFIKVFNIAGLPILVVIVGIVIWLARGARKRRIEIEFAGRTAGESHE